MMKPWILAAAMAATMALAMVVLGLAGIYVHGHGATVSPAAGERSVAHGQDGDGALAGPSVTPSPPAPTVMPGNPISTPAPSALPGKAIDDTIADLIGGEGSDGYEEDGLPTPVGL